MPYALQVVVDADHDREWHWVVLEEHADTDGERLVYTPHSAGECGFSTYADALNAGTLALAAADGQPYENEAADPVGDADCAQQVEPVGALRPVAYVSRANPRTGVEGGDATARPGQTSNRYGTPLALDRKR